MNLLNAEIVLDAEAILSAIGLLIVQRISVVRCYTASHLPWHDHPFFELLLLVEGAATYEFLSGKVVELTGGQLMIIPPKTMHRGLHNVRRPSKLCGIMLTPDLMRGEQHTPFDAQDLEWIQQQYSQSAMMPIKMSDRLKQFVSELSTKVTHFDLSSRQSVLRTRVKLSQVIYEVAKDASCPQSSQQTSTVSSTIQFMREHLNDPLSIDEVAEAAGCSRSKLYELFKQSTGMTPNDYWQRLRIEQAYERVVRTNEPITKIALDCGFNTSQYFCTVFRKYWGLSPRECRNVISSAK